MMGMNDENGHLYAINAMARFTDLGTENIDAASLQSYFRNSYDAHRFIQFYYSLDLKATSFFYY